jgi:hypothetical protein
MRVRVSEPCAVVYSAARRRFMAVPDAAPAVAEGCDVDGRPASGGTYRLNPREGSREPVGC